LKGEPGDPKTQEKIECMIDNGFFFTSRKEMDPLIDRECIRPSRVLLTKLFIELGSDPNHFSPEVNMTPLHWLCFWGDHRASRMLCFLNRQDLMNVNVEKTFFKKTRETIFKERGNLNMFFSEEKDTPADVAGIMKNHKCLFNIVEYFMEKQDDIRKAFMGQAEVEKIDQDPTRVAQQRSKSMVLNKSEIDEELIRVNFIDSKNFNIQQLSLLRLAYRAIAVFNFDHEQRMEKEPLDKPTKNKHNI
jgi:hypothetical protein